jgi:uncharacterized damage-inducible protein DinB
MQDDDAVALRTFLDAQRRCALEIVDGLDHILMRQSVVPSGWTPLSMVEHLADAERFWFVRIVAGVARSAELPGPEEVAADEALSPPPVHEVIDLYRAQIAASDQILTRVGMDARPAGRVPPDMADEIRTVRDVVLHLIEETARHAGHLDIARELLDGQTGLGPR